MNIGVDLVNINRKEFQDDKLAKRICTQDEFLYFQSLENKNVKIRYLASLWAIKEAVIKATNKELGISEINVVKTNGVRKVFAKKYNIKASLSYQDNYVVAMVLVME